MLKKQHGFSLIEMMVALLIMVVVSTSIVRSVSGLHEPVVYQQTQDRVQAIKDAIINVQTVNGVPVVSGFVADMGRLPTCLHELIAPYGCDTTVSPPVLHATPDPSWGVIGTCNISGSISYLTNIDCTNLAAPAIPTSWTPLQGVGWNGPYLQTSNSPTSPDAFTDGWGNDITQSSISPLVPATSCTSGTTLILLPDNNSYCTTPDQFNYGWNYYLTYDATNTFGVAANLQSVGSNRLIGTLLSPTDPNYQYEADYPSNQLVIPQQDWQFDLSSTSVTINFSNTNFSPTSLTVTSTTNADFPTVCNMVGGTWTSPNCTITPTLAFCNVLGGSWATPTCTLTQTPLQSLCSSRGGTWSDTHCILTTLSSSDCASLGGSYASSSCTLLAPPSLATTCPLIGGTWEASNCSFSSVAQIFSNTLGVSGISNFCTAIGGLYTASDTNLTPAAPSCFIGLPLLPLTPAACISSYPQQCQQNICLNIFYRDSTTQSIAVQTALSSVQTDGQPHSVVFSGFRAYVPSAPTTPITPAPLPAGQNAISVTQPNSTGPNPGSCDGTSHLNHPYPTNHPSPVPQIFRPGMPLVFNW